MDLLLYHNKHGGSMVDVLCLRNLCVLGHLVDLADHRDVHKVADELRLRGFTRLRHSLRLRDLSLHHNRHGGNNLVDGLYLREYGMLCHLVDQEALGHRRSAYASRCAPRNHRHDWRHGDVGILRHEAL